MAQEVSSITRVGTSEPFELQVARGQIAYHNTLFKFGFNPYVGSNKIWHAGNDGAAVLLPPFFQFFNLLFFGFH